MQYLKKYYLNILFLILSILYIVQIDCFRDNFFIAENKKYEIFLFKITADIIIITFGQLVCHLLKGLQKREKFAVKFTAIFFILFSLSFTLYLYTNLASFNWYMWDVYSIFEKALKFDFNCSNHPFTVLYYIIALNIFPFKGGIILFQIIISSFIFAFIWTKLNNILNYRYKWLLLMPLFLFPIIRMGLQPIRSCVYYVFPILLFALFYFKNKENKPINYLETVYLSVLSAVVCAWRSENIVLFVIIPIMLFILGQKKINIIKTIIFLLIFYSISGITSLYISKTFNVYALLPFKRSISAILKTDFKTNNKEKDIEIISRCFSAQKLKELELNEALLVPLEELAPKDVPNFVKTSIKLILLNPKTYIQERMNLSNNLTKFNLLTDGINEYELNSPTSKIIRTLECEKVGANPNYYFMIVYSPIIPAIFLLTALIVSALKRNKMVFTIIFTSLTMSIFSYFFCAEPFFHYFIQSYLFGWFIFSYFIMIILNKLRYNCPSKNSR